MEIDDQAQKPGGAIWISAEGNARQDGKLLNGPLIVPDAESRHAKVQKHVAEILPNAPPREWWIVDFNGYQNNCGGSAYLLSEGPPNDPDEPYIHVIEKSAYDEVIELSALDNAALCDCQIERDALAKRVAELGAHPKKWKFHDTHEYRDELERDFKEQSEELATAQARIAELEQQNRHAGVNWVPAEELAAARERFDNLKAVADTITDSLFATEKERDAAKAEIESLQFNLKQKEGEIGRAEHRGNTVDYIYDKLENYSRQLREVGPALTQANQRIKTLEETLKHDVDKN